MASPQCSKRLTKEYKKIVEIPVDLIQTHPSESNILDWHFIITGPPGTAFEGGEYHGALNFPPQYPFKPPGIRVFTPNGRFVPNQKICLSMSDFHPESWNPAWSVSTILTALVSFMTGNEPATGCCTTTPIVRQNYAQSSHGFNLNNPVFRREFPYLSKDIDKATNELLARNAKAMEEFNKLVGNPQKRKQPVPEKPKTNEVVEVIDDDDEDEVVVLDDQSNDPIVID